MKVILIDVLPKLGKIGDVVVVKNGYAKNFLIPNKKAICFTNDNYKTFEAKKNHFELESAKKLDISNKVKSALEGKDIVIIENASDDGRLYGSVNSSVISSKINEAVGEKLVEKSSIFLNKPIKEVGIYDIKLVLHSESAFVIKLVVSRSDSEAQALLNPSKKSKSKEKVDNEKTVSDATNSSSDSVDKAIKKNRKKKTNSEE